VRTGILLILSERLEQVFQFIHDAHDFLATLVAVQLMCDFYKKWMHDMPPTDKNTQAACPVEYESGLPSDLAALAFPVTITACRDRMRTARSGYALAVWLIRRMPAPVSVEIIKQETLAFPVTLGYTRDDCTLFRFFRKFLAVSAVNYLLMICN
jgi:hypothetical protein